MPNFVIGNGSSSNLAVTFTAKKMRTDQSGTPSRVAAALSAHLPLSASHLRPNLPTCSDVRASPSSAHTTSFKILKKWFRR